MIINFREYYYYEMRKSNAFSLLLLNLSSASDILFSSKPRSSSSLNGIKCSTICKMRKGERDRERYLIDVFVSFSE